MTGTECNGCGACCDPVMLPFAPSDFELFPSSFDPAELAFFREHLTPIRRREGRQKVMHWSSGWSEMIHDGEPVMLAAHYYECDRYDPVAKVCTAYDDRPDFCRDYPWYGDAPDPNKALPPTCSYRADVGRDVMGVEVEISLRGQRGAAMDEEPGFVRRSVR
jgi:Fe-S-cluster containining protein